MDWVESAEAIGEVDDLLASVGLGHGKRKTLAGTWKGGERQGRALQPPVQRPPAKRIAAKGVAVVRAPGWETHGWLRHGFSTRAGGVSSIYGPGLLNLGWTKEDETAKVTENRR